MAHYTRSCNSQNDGKWYKLSMLVLVALVIGATMTNAQRSFGGSRLKIKRESADGNEPTSDSGTEAAEEQACTIEYQETQREVGKCIRVLGGQPVCQGPRFMDPLNPACRQ